MVRSYSKAISLVFILLLTACGKEDTRPSPPPVSGAQKVFIVCEGSLGNGNGQLDLYLPEKDSFYQNVYEAVNGHGLGDVFHSIYREGDRYFLCINNSDKVAVLDQELRLLTNINIPKPRYVRQAGPNKLYVSSLFENKLYKIDTNGNNLGTLELKGRSTEGMLLFDRMMYVCSWDTSINYIYAIDATTDQLKDSFAVGGYAPQEVLLDREQKLWVLSGNATEGRTAALTRLDPITGKQLKVFHFPIEADVVRPVFNPNRDSLYFIQVNYSGGSSNNGIYRMSIQDQKLPAQAFIAAQPFQYFWALGIDPVTGNVYAGNPKGFVQKGAMLIYGQDGSLKHELPCGVGPGHFYFDQ